MNEIKSQTVWRVRILSSTWLSYAGFYFCRKNYTIVKAQIQENFQINASELAHLFTAYLVAYMLGQYMSGLLGRRTAARVLLLTGMAVTIVCNLVFGTSILMGPAGYFPMMIFMVVNGFAQATGWPGNVGVLGNWLSRTERGRVMAIWATSYQLGSSLAKIFASAMLGWLGLSWSFWGASIIMFGVWIFFYIFEKDTPEEAGLPPVVEEVEVTPEEQAKVSAETGNFLGWSRQVFFSVIFIGMTYFVFKFCRYAMDSWVPYILNIKFKLDGEIAGYISTLFDWVGFLGVLFAGWFSDRFFGGRRHQIVLYMTIGMAITLFLMVSIGMQTLWLFAVFLAVTGFMLMGPDSLLSGVAAIDVGGRRGAILAAGIINGLGSIGPIIQEEAIGWVLKEYNFTVSFYLLVFIAILGVGGTAFLSYRSRRGLSNL
ncbi:MAG: MFS transporter [Leptospiraceae bacterium]|nr:MFS transporter [Leptospiraceae bacterium]